MALKGSLFATKPFIYETEDRDFWRVVIDTRTDTGTAQMIAGRFNSKQRVDEPRVEFVYDTERGDKRQFSYLSRAPIYGPAKNQTLEQLLTGHE